MCQEGRFRSWMAFGFGVVMDAAPALLGDRWRYPPR